MCVYVDMMVHVHAVHSWMWFAHRKHTFVWQVTNLSCTDLSEWWCAMEQSQIMATTFLIFDHQSTICSGTIAMITRYYYFL